ncbi:kinetochore-associated protein NSL1 homolog [Menidia menidia]
MEHPQSETSPSEEPNQEYRIEVTSKKRLTETINKCKEILKRALDGQPEVAEETKRVLLEELLANFEAAVQINVLVNGQPWEDAPDVEDDEAVDLDSLLDDAIVETTRRRRTYPKKILPHVVHALKAERKILGLYEHAVQTPETRTHPDPGTDPDPESLMSTLSAAAPGMVKQAIQVIKSISSLQQQAEGLCQVLSSEPSPASAQIHREVFGQSDAPAAATRSRRPIKRAVEEAAAAEGYKKAAPERRSCT